MIGVALLALAGLGYCLMNQGETPPDTSVAGVPDAAVPQRSTALVDDTLEIPEEEPDAWLFVPDAGPLPRQRVSSVGSWECNGELDRAALQSAIAEYSPQIQNCYERRLKAQPFLQGNMSLQMRVMQAGTVDAVQVGGSLRDREVFACVRNVAQRMRFARVTGGNCAVVSVPFSFTPRQ